MADLDSFFARKDKKKVKGRKFTTTDEIARRLEETEKKLEHQQQQGVKAKVEPLVKKQEQQEENTTTEEYPLAEDNPPKVNIHVALPSLFFPIRISFIAYHNIQILFHQLLALCRPPIFK